MNYSTRGQPRRVTDAQIAEIVAWRRTHETLAQVAARLGLSRSTAARIAQTGGTHYKQPSPEKRAAAQAAARAHRSKLEARYLIA